MSAPLEVVGIRYSPYTEKALWALDHHQRKYQYREHLVLLGDALLEFRVKRLGGVIPSEGLTVPVLFEPGQVTFDSFAILQKVDQESAWPERTLIPEGSLPEVKHFNLLADTIMGAGRALYMDRLSRSLEGQLASFPRWIPARPRWVRSSMLPLVRMGIDSVDEQFRIRRKGLSEHSNALLQCLVGLRSHREKSGGSLFLLGNAFSAADLCVASALSVVRPPAFLKGRADPALLALWTHPEFSEAFEDLLEWREQIYAGFRKV